MEGDDECAPKQGADTVPSFCTAAPKPTTFVYFTERYFSQFVVRNCKQVEGNNVRLLLHSNGLCVMCLDPSHAVISEKLRVTQLSHSIRRGPQFQDRSPIKTQGKRKKHAMLCQRDMVLLFIETDCGRSFRVPACVDGVVLEINQYLVQRPQLVVESPTVEGFVAIINPYAKMDFGAYEKVITATNGELYGEED
jgi:hypothetical protein